MFDLETIYALRWQLTIFGLGVLAGVVIVVTHAHPLDWASTAVSSIRSWR
ncbi:hypothetical protein [Bradyrhizobium sp. Y36]|nr:hypothetical protein [Bradyrhizobium sp. Y36]